MPVDADTAPARGLDTLDLVGGIGERERPVDGDAVIIEKNDQPVELQMPGQRDRFLADALHQITIGSQHEGVVIDEIGAVFGGEHALGQGHADCGGNALPERAGRGLDTRGDEILRMARRQRMQLAEILQFVDGHALHAGEMQKRIEQHRAVAGGEHETVAIGPGGIGDVVFEMAREQHRGDIRGAHGQAGVAGFGFLDGIHGEGAHGIGHLRMGDGRRRGLVGHWFAVRFCCHETRRMRRRMRSLGKGLGKDCGVISMAGGRVNAAHGPGDRYRPIQPVCLAGKPAWARAAAISGAAQVPVTVAVAASRSTAISACESRRASTLSTAFTQPPHCMPSTVKRMVVRPVAGWSVIACFLRFVPGPGDCRSSPPTGPAVRRDRQTWLRPRYRPENRGGQVRKNLQTGRGRGVLLQGLVLRSPERLHRIGKGAEHSDLDEMARLPHPFCGTARRLAQARSHCASTAWRDDAPPR